MTPRSFIKQLEAEVRAMLKAGNYPEANQIFARHFDMDIFTQRCLIDHWRELNKEERVQLIDLFGRNIRKRMNE